MIMTDAFDLCIGYLVLFLERIRKHEKVKRVSWGLMMEIFYMFYFILFIFLMLFKIIIDCDYLGSLLDIPLITIATFWIILK